MTKIKLVFVNQVMKEFYVMNVLQTMEKLVIMNVVRVIVSTVYY